MKSTMTPFNLSGLLRAFVSDFLLLLAWKVSPSERIIMVGRQPYHGAAMEAVDAVIASESTLDDWDDFEEDAA